MANLFQIRRLVILILIAAFLYYIQDTLYPVIFSIILFYLLNPIVQLLQKKDGRKWGLNVELAILISFIIAILFIFFFFQFIIPPLANEFQGFGRNIPAFIEGTQRTMSGLRTWYRGYEIPIVLQNIITQGFENIIKTLIDLSQSAASSMFRVAGQFIRIIIIPIMTYYLLKDKDLLKNGALDLIAPDYRKKAEKIVSRINTTLKSYVRGIGALCIMVGGLAAIGLYFLGVKYYIVLGLIAGVTEAIPILGPWIGAVPAVIIAFIYDPILAVKVIALYLIIQGFENAILVPKVLGDYLEIHPVPIIISFLVCGKFFGAWGLFFAAPIVAILNIVYQELRT